MIGENIKSLRRTHDLTQPEFAKIVGISRNSLSRYENGQALFRQNSLIEFAKNSTCHMSIL